MPSYVYRCTRSHEVEEQRKIADRDQPLVCRACAAENHVEVMARVPAVSTGKVGFPGAGSWRDNYR